MATWAFVLITIAKAARRAPYEFGGIHADAVNLREAILQTLASLALMVSVGKVPITEIHQTVSFVFGWRILFFDKALTSICQAKRG